MGKNRLHLKGNFNNEINGKIEVLITLYRYRRTVVNNSDHQKYDKTSTSNNKNKSQLLYSPIPELHL